jgi:uncharacterized protein YndB with AHSA1/START domain
MSTAQLISTVIDMTSGTGHDEHRNDERQAGRPTAMMRRPARVVYDGAVTFPVRASPDVVFDFITDVDRLPQWNARIPRVIKSVEDLVEGSEWVIVQRGLGPGVRWGSRAQVIELNRATRRFVYRSRSEGPNPSFAMWTWNVTPAVNGSVITVSWQLNPMTFWRKALAARLRHRQLKREVRASLEEMARLIDASSSG